MNVGEKIKELRESKGLNQKEFGELFEPNISQATVSSWERNASNPPYKHHKKILSMINESYSEFFGSDYIGNQYGELTVVDDLGGVFEKNSTIGRRIIVCSCSCGNINNYRLDGVISGSITSCGHVHDDLASKKIKSFFEKAHKEKGTNLKLIDTNRKLVKTNTSGKTGVSFDKSRGKWVASMRLKGKAIYIGRFDKKEDAIKARLKAEEEYFVPILEKHKDVFEQ